MTDPAEVDDLTFDTDNMTPEERLLADQVYACIQDYSKQSERSLQSANFDLGISDLGTCSELVRRSLANISPSEDKDVLAAFVGTAVGDHVERAIARRHPEALLGTSVRVFLQGDGGMYELTGHPDVVLPWGIIDAKSVNGLQLVRRTGPTQQQLFQRHLYTKGASEAGLLAVPLEEAKTANVWIDRSGATRQLHVHMDTYDPDIVMAATIWLDDVVYAWQNNEAARKEPPRTWCEKVCGHFADCRGMDSDVEGLITDPVTLTAVAMYQEGLALERQGKALKKEARPELEGVRGNTGEWSIRWTHVNGTHVEAFDKAAFDRLNISKMR